MDPLRLSNVIIHIEIMKKGGLLMKKLLIVLSALILSPAAFAADADVLAVERPDDDDLRLVRQWHHFQTPNLILILMRLKLE